MNGLSYGCARPHRWAGEGKGRQVLADMGLSVSDAIRLLLVRVAAERAMPFEIKAPNAETRTAMAELEQGAGKSFDSVAELMADLKAED